MLAVLGAATGYSYARSQRAIYQARLTMEVQSANENFMNLREVDPTSGANSAESLQTQLKILQSDPLFTRVRKSLEPLAMVMRKAPPPPPHPWLKGLPAFRPVTFAEEMDAAPDNLKVRVNGLSRLVELRFDSADPLFAAEFLNRLVDDYVKLNLDHRWTQTQQTSEWMNKNLEELRAKLQRDETRMQVYA